MTNKNYMVLADYPWFKQLLGYSEFESLVERRYRELRKGVLSDEYIEKLVWDTQAYLGNALSREQSAFGSYVYDLGEFEEEATGLSIARTQTSPEAEAQRILDFLRLHGEYLDKRIFELQSYVQYRGNTLYVNTIFASVLILVFFVSTVLARRYRQIR